MSQKREIFMDLCQLVMSAAAIQLIILIIPGSMALFTQKGQWAPVMTQLLVRPADLFLVLALWAMLASLWLYLYWVLPYAGERPLDQVVSLFLAVLIFLTNYFVMVPELFPFRFFFISGVLGVTWYKDAVFARRFAGTSYAATVNRWRRNVRWTFLFSVVGACCFAALSHPLIWSALSSSLFGQPVRVSRLYEVILAAAFNVTILAVSVRSLSKNFIYFNAYGEEDIQILRLWAEAERSKV